MSHVYVISHPEVTIDRHLPVPEWDLSPRGRARLTVLLQQPWMPTIRTLFASTERKAQTTADAVARAYALKVQHVPELGEMDRSSTGMLEPDQFEQVVEAFFAEPQRSVLGWERAIDAQQRIVRALDRLLTMIAPADPVATVSHGGVGALLLSHLRGSPISRADDQPGQGHYFVFAKATRTVVHGWHPIDATPIG